MIADQCVSECQNRLVVERAHLLWPNLGMGGFKMCMKEWAECIHGGQLHTLASVQMWLTE
jgi:hypothetical protein